MSADPKRLEKASWPAQQLVAEHPAQFDDSNKRLVHSLACPAGSAPKGTVSYSRWAEVALPDSMDLTAAGAALAPLPGFYDYEPTSGLTGPVVDWHVNFAHLELFAFYSGPLFAQDEMQVVEHPALASVREAIVSQGREPLTVERGHATPILIRGVERRCRVAIDADAKAGRSRGLYGNEFTRAKPASITKAVTVIDPPTISNFIAMAAPAYGSGAYSTEELRKVLITAASAFRAAVLESHEVVVPGAKTVVHSGFWGCGAFGGNRVVMTVLQAMAAQLAGVQRLVFHHGNAGGVAAIDEARALLKEIGAGSRVPSLEAVVELIRQKGFRWGVSNGT